MSRLSRVERRLLLTIWIVAAAHATTNVVRETYLAVALAERATIRVDPYLGLNPDLFEIPGHGAFINNNPGASILGAIPYAVARPLVEIVYRLRPGLVSEKTATRYDDPRPNRTTYMNRMRERGLDVRLAVAALIIQAGLMAPLAALAALVLRRHVARRGADDRAATALALVYALATPILFRSAYLNQNVLVAHGVLFAWVILQQPADGGAARSRQWLAAGGLLGGALLCDYSAAPIVVVVAIWAAIEGWRTGGAAGAARRAADFTLGAVGPVLLLLAYQHLAFGSPWFPAQRYMPSTPFSVRGWNGMTPPSGELLVRHLVDPRYGLFVFCPLLLLAFAPARWRSPAAAPTRGAALAGWSACAALWLFQSANQFAHLQRDTGVRYMIPAVPLLFLLSVPVLLRLSPLARAAWVVPTALVSWAVAMAREDVVTSLRLLVEQGPALPLLRTLHKTAEAYAPWLAGGIQPWGALAVALVAAAVAAIWLLPKQRDAVRA